jgi:hypothetical protein
MQGLAVFKFFTAHFITSTRHQGPFRPWSNYFDRNGIWPVAGAVALAGETGMQPTASSVLEGTWPCCTANLANSDAVKKTGARIKALICINTFLQTYNYLLACFQGRLVFFANRIYDLSAGGSKHLLIFAFQGIKF